MPGDGNRAGVLRKWKKRSGRRRQPPVVGIQGVHQDAPGAAVTDPIIETDCRADDPPEARPSNWA